MDYCVICIDMATQEQTVYANTVRAAFINHVDVDSLQKMFTKHDFVRCGSKFFRLVMKDEMLRIVFSEELLALTN